VPNAVTNAAIDAIVAGRMMRTCSNVVEDITRDKFQPLSR
jgi:hypothetical protein